jgi:hypothetical protein
MRDAFKQALQSRGMDPERYMRDPGSDVARSER